MRAVLIPLMLVWLAACSAQATDPAPAAAAQPSVHPLSGLEVIPLTIRPVGREPHTVRVEVAATDEALAGVIRGQHHFARDTAIHEGGG